MCRHGAGDVMCLHDDELKVQLHPLIEQGCGDEERRCG